MSLTLRAWELGTSAITLLKAIEGGMILIMGALTTGAIWIFGVTTMLGSFACANAGPAAKTAAAAIATAKNTLRITPISFRALLCKAQWLNRR